MTAKMPSAAAATAATLVMHPPRGTPPSSPPAGPPRLISFRTRRPPRTFPAAAGVSSSASPPGPATELEAAQWLGARVRVTAPVRVHHVQRAPELELAGMEGVIRQYAGLWKGKRVSANLPFRVEFALPGAIEGRPGPVRFFAHLREGEFECLPQD